MATKKKNNVSENAVVADMGSPNSEPQWKFFLSKSKYTCYGGARGGGKSWAVIRKAAMGAYNYPGIQMIILRREYDQMENPIITPMLQILAPGTFKYNKTDHVLTFSNGSMIKFGNMPDYDAATGGKYQGQSYDWMFIDEATQFTESEFRGLAACVRGANDIPKRIYLTCNPGGVGHFWVKRLFVDREYREDENPDDYTFIPATVDDNVDLIRSNPDYVKQLELLPEDIRRAHRYGDWNALSGVYFEEFREGIHTCKPFPIPQHWQHYRSFDYGLDMFFCLWIAVDEIGRCYVYRSHNEPNLVVSQAAAKQLEMTRPDEKIYYSIAPPDMWSRNRDTGKTQAAMFMENGVALVRADNSRKQGWAAMKDMFRVRPEFGGPGFVIFDTCGTLIDCIKSLQHDKNDPNDVADKPHDITHGPDALRYFCQTRVLSAEAQKEGIDPDEDYGAEDYRSAVCGKTVTRSYILS